MEDNNTLGSSEVIARLFDIIAHLSETNRRKLLELLEKRNPSRYTIKRHYSRKPTKISMDFSVDDFSFTSFTQNVSKSGAFIETDLPFLADKELSMAFTLPGYKDSIKTSGKIVRSDSKGIGVQFDEPLSDI